MKISVIIPTYHPQDYLWDCLLSMEKQTLCHADYEVLLVLNGPHDPYRQQIESYLANHPALPCTLLESAPAGVSRARNFGLDAAQGEYITFVDDDDMVSPTYLEDLLAISSQDCIGLGYMYSFEDHEQAYAHLPEQIPYSLTREYDRHAPQGKQSWKNVRRFFAGPYIKMIHRNIIGDRRFDERFQNLEDVLFCFTISDRFTWVDFAPVSASYYRRMRATSTAHHRQMFQRIGHSLKAIMAYTTVYFRTPNMYHFPFYVTRVLGAIKGALTPDA